MKLIRTLAAFALVALALSVAKPAFATGYYWNLTVGTVMVDGTAYSVWFPQVGIWTDPCGWSESETQWFYVDSTHPRAKEMYAVLLAAFLTGKRVHIVYEGCVNRRALISSVTVSS